MWMQTSSTGTRKESTYRKLVDNGSAQASLKTARTNVSTADHYFPEILAIQNIVVEIILRKTDRSMRQHYLCSNTKYYGVGF
jgi:hypothetical protein